MGITRHTTDGRRATELDKRKPQERFKTTPNIKQIEDGQVVIVKDGTICWRDGDILYTATGTPV